MDLEDRIDTLRYEIEDAEQFLVHLRKSLDDFNDAHVTFSSLGHVRFEFCPACFTPTKEASDDHHCHLCGAESVEEHDDSKALAVRLDIEMQLRESLALQEERQTEFRDLNARLRTARSRVRNSWLRVSGTTEMPQIDQGIRHQLHTVMALLFELEAQQQPFEFILPREGPFYAQP